MYWLDRRLSMFCCISAIYLLFFLLSQNVHLCSEYICHQLCCLYLFRTEGACADWWSGSQFVRHSDFIWLALPSWTLTNDNFALLRCRRSSFICLYSQQMRCEALNIHIQFVHLALTKKRLIAHISLWIYRFTSHQYLTNTLKHNCILRNTN